jgi:hypothetical protein
MRILLLVKSDLVKTILMWIAGLAVLVLILWELSRRMMIL